MPRKPRLDAPGVLHHVMIRGIERRNIFRSQKDRRDLVDRLSRLIPATETSCYAWAFMPNHAHFLFRSGPEGIAHLMRKLLTGYAVSFNRRYSRQGQLFQNRYKSIICDEDAYFKELVRYIHLNPVRAGITRTMEDLDNYPWSGHSALMGITERSFQDTGYVLSAFSGKRTRYRSYIASAFNEGRREDLSGGDLVMGIDSLMKTRDDHRVKGDRRILGGSEFVTKIFDDAGASLDHRYVIKSKGYTLETIADMIASVFHITPQDILSKGRSLLRVKARSLFCYIANRDLGTSGTDLARLTGMTPAAISYAVERGKHIAQEMDFRLE